MRSREAQHPQTVAANRVAVQARKAVAGGIILLPLIFAQAAAAQTFSVIYNFRGAPDGYRPEGALIADQAGNLYGAAAQGGTNNCVFGGLQLGCGTVYELPASGAEKALYNFTGGTDGAAPYGGVIRDTEGNLYGTTSLGGISTGSCASFTSCGVVFQLSPQGKETVLYSFTGGADGADPRAGVVRDTAGNIYGTTFYGGDFTGYCAQFGTLGCGVVFKVDPAGNETVLHAFTGPPDGLNPDAALVMDSAGNLYGTTWAGGVDGLCFGTGCGVVFKLDPAGNETVLYAFGSVEYDGLTPQGGLILDSSGNLYGTTSGGGVHYACNCGTVFKLDPAGNETILHNFAPHGDGGQNPEGGVIRDAKGNLYGTASSGGDFTGACAPAGCGAVFELTPGGREIVLHDFDLRDGSLPSAHLLWHKGKLYGTASEGGLGGLALGVVFKIQP